ncbi:RRS1-domain-containing protein [Sistotremastrum suecicum HHB10207 ss-3]|uniref:Ribosome biogenesis regulatory protein n=1 Tax=Sistotremastrum suecicum HHB10207 ss-3 TaxID=1314776 RepID=A0A166HQM8_9AGAM|nr:RRS1-domain-containing protein [Sistotremastrum suecicum HHB10207 ss-3]
MDVSTLLQAQNDKFKSIEVDKELEIDPGLLLVSDLNPIDAEAYEANLEDHLQSTARDGVQALLAALFSLPIHSSPDGPVAKLPAPTYELPRAKPLPKPKPQTKWERFASAKGIQHSVKDKKVWDEEKQDWVNRWGRYGKNKELEDQWLTEVPANADVDFDPAKDAKTKRKEVIAKNTKQRDANLARAQKAADPKESRKKEIESTLQSTRKSTASMGKFDKKLDGEKKIRGIKRKFEPAEVSAANERKSSLAILAGLEGSSAKKARRAEQDGQGASDVVNVRKAVKFASGGKGSHSLARSASTQKGKTSFKKGKR